MMQKVSDALLLEVLPAKNFGFRVPEKKKSRVSGKGFGYGLKTAKNRSESCKNVYGFLFREYNTQITVENSFLLLPSSYQPPGKKILTTTSPPTPPEPVDPCKVPLRPSSRAETSSTRRFSFCTRRYLSKWLLANLTVFLPFLFPSFSGSLLR